MSATRVEVPGTFTAEYRDGVIEKLTFMPSASYAGYFGPAAVVFDGDEELDVESTEGPFWRAMQSAIGKVNIEWEE